MCWLCLELRNGLNKAFIYSSSPLDFLTCSCTLCSTLVLTIDLLGRLWKPLRNGAYWRRFNAGGLVLRKISKTFAEPSLVSFYNSKLLQNTESVPGSLLYSLPCVLSCCPSQEDFTRGMHTHKLYTNWDNHSVLHFHFLKFWPI